MKKVLLAVALFASTMAFAYVVNLSVEGMGTAYNADQQQADQQADQQAQADMQNHCVAGTIVSSHKASDNCGNLSSDPNNPNYMCSVGYVGVCQSGR
jgi:hypothetical protein